MAEQCASEHHSYRVKGFETIPNRPELTNLVTRVCETCGYEYKQYEIGSFNDFSMPFRVEPYQEV